MSAPQFSVKKALETVAGLSNPSKMPGFAYSIPARECHTGNKLRTVTGSTCSGCYALKGRYGFKNVQDAQYGRLDSVLEACQQLDSGIMPEWVSAMVYLIRTRKMQEFRWHDSGDLQSVAHLQLIVEVARQTPECKHWLPTREFGIVSQYFQTGHDKPSNLNIRLSAHMVDGRAPVRLARRYGLTVSEVSSTSGDCHAQVSGSGTCDECRACWDENVFCVTYRKH